MKKSRLLGVVCACVFSFVFTSSHATLIPVLGGQAYYDDVADLTWLTNANAGAGSAFDDGSSTTDGNMTWANANNWAASLNINGVTGWRLPINNPIDGTTTDDVTLAYNGSEDRGYNVSAPGTLYAGSMASEMAFLFYNTLSNKGYCDPLLSTASTCSVTLGLYGFFNTGPFSNTSFNGYWSGTDYLGDTPPNNNYAWTFFFNNGSQTVDKKDDHYLKAWAVYSGNAADAVVPIPPALWLFGSGLLGLIGVARKKAA